MICKKTWPNPSGTDKDGTHEILKSQNRAGDVTYGNTKVFIKSPETIFELEEARYAHLLNNFLISLKILCHPFMQMYII